LKAVASYFASAISPGWTPTRISSSRATQRTTWSRGPTTLLARRWRTPTGWNSPVTFFQRLDDKVVTPAQSESMVAAMKRRGVPVEYHAFEGEGHGFREAATIETCLDAELAFYGRVFGFGQGRPADG
jgi:acetyl esterase/lipase